MRNEIVLFVNGHERRVTGAHAFLTLSTWLRHVEHMVGTKIVCEEGDCGACTILVGRARPDGLVYEPVNSCIQLVAQLDATHLVTVEGLSRGEELSAIQQQMVDHHGAQCGFCTPGFVVALTALQESRGEWSEPEVRQALTGNLCRCTGYEPIIKAALAARSTPPRLSELYPPAPLQRDLTQLREESVDVSSDGRRFFAPATLEEALRFRAGHPDCVIVQGATDVGVLANKRAFAPPLLMTLAHIESLDEATFRQGELHLGANVSLSRLEKEAAEHIPELHRILTLFGSPQIRNAGTVVGNIANGSPIADLLPFLFVSGSRLRVASTSGEREIEIDRLYLGYKSLDLGRDELITGVIIPLPHPDTTLKLYKVSRRRDLDISSFTAAVAMQLRDGALRHVRLAYGGVAPTVVRLPATEALLEGQAPTEELFREAGEKARGEIAPISDVRGSADFRLQLAGNILTKFYLEALAPDR